MHWRHNGVLWCSQPLPCCPHSLTPALPLAHHTPERGEERVRKEVSTPWLLQGRPPTCTPALKPGGGKRLQMPLAKVRPPLEG